MLSETETSRYVEITDGDEFNAFRIHYHDAGEGPVVIMLHGGGPGASGWSNFVRNIGPFTEAGFRVLLIDQPGYAKSGEIVSGTQRGLLNARAVKVVMDALDIETAHFVGNSMGGFATLTFAVEYPDRIGRMVLLGPGGLGPSILQPNPQEGIRLMFRAVDDPTDENIDVMLNALVYDPSQITPALREHRHNAVRSNMQHMENVKKSFALSPFAHFDIRPRLGEAKAPALVIWGRDDRFVPLDNGLQLLTLLPDADLHVFQRCGHSAQYEHADKFNGLAIPFFRQ